MKSKAFLFSVSMIVLLGQAGAAPLSTYRSQIPALQSKNLAPQALKRASELETLLKKDFTFSLQVQYPELSRYHEAVLPVLLSLDSARVQQPWLQTTWPLQWNVVKDSVRKMNGISSSRSYGSVHDGGYEYPGRW